MNIARFQFAVNHVEPNIVKTGLEGFADQILADHKVVAEFGYYGRNESYSVEDVVLGSRKYNGTKPVCGLLATYLQASPRAEELFVIWNMSDRLLDKELCIAHMKAIATILHCARCDAKVSELANAIATRIIEEHIKSIKTQLNDSDSAELVHATLGLLMEMCCVSRGVAMIVLDKLIFTEPKYNQQTATLEISLSPEYLNCSKHGNAVKWICKGTQIVTAQVTDAQQPTEATTTATVAAKFETETRYMCLLLLLQAMISIDDPSSSIPSSSVSKMVNQLTNSAHSPLKRLLVGIAKDSLATVRLALNGFMILQSRSLAFGGVFTQLCSIAVIDSQILTKIINLYDNKMKKYQEIAHQFLVYFVKELQTIGNRSQKQSQASNVMRMLSAHTDIRHREILMYILQKFPELVPKCIASIPINWLQPNNSIEYIGSITLLIFILNKAEIDVTIAQQLQSIVLLQSAEQQNSSATITTTTATTTASFDEVMLTVLPITLTKKELTKLVNNEDLDLQRLGFELLSTILQRISKMLSFGFKQQQLFPIAFQNQICKIIPDFLAITNSWNKIIKYLKEYQTTSKNNEETDENIFSDAIDLLAIITTAIDQYLQQVPSSTALYDFCRLLEDIVIVENPLESIDWSVDMLGNTVCTEAMSSRMTCILEMIVNISYQATKLRKCRWLSGKEEITKVMTNIIVNQRWQDVVKISSLSKLMLLMCCHSSVCNDSIRQRTYEVFHELIIQSDMFSGSDAHYANLSLELRSWLQPFHKSLSHSIIPSDVMNYIQLVDILLRIGFHWNIELCNYPTTISIATDDEIVLSPVFIAGFCLSIGNLSFLKSNIPNNIKLHLDDKASIYSDSTFFAKFVSGFQSNCQSAIESLLGTLIATNSSNESIQIYSQFVLAVDRSDISCDWLKKLCNLTALTNASSMKAEYLTSDESSYIQHLISSKAIPLVTTSKTPTKKKSHSSIDSASKVITESIDCNVVRDMILSESDHLLCSLSTVLTILTYLPNCLADIFVMKSVTQEIQYVVQNQIRNLLVSDVVVAVGLAKQWASRALTGEVIAIEEQVIINVLNWLKGHLIVFANVGIDQIHKLDIIALVSLLPDLLDSLVRLMKLLTSCEKIRNTFLEFSVLANRIVSKGLSKHIDRAVAVTVLNNTLCATRVATACQQLIDAGNLSDSVASIIIHSTAVDKTLSIDTIDCAVCEICVNFLIVSIYTIIIGHKGFKQTDNTTAIGLASQIEDVLAQLSPTLNNISSSLVITAVPKVVLDLFVICLPSLSIDCTVRESIITLLITNMSREGLLVVTKDNQQTADPLNIVTIDEFQQLMCHMISSTMLPKVFVDLLSSNSFSQADKHSLLSNCCFKLDNNNNSNNKYHEIIYYSDLASLFAANANDVVMQLSQQFDDVICIVKAAKALGNTVHYRNFLKVIAHHNNVSVSSSLLIDLLLMRFPSDVLQRVTLGSNWIGSLYSEKIIEELYAMLHINWSANSFSGSGNTYCKEEHIHYCIDFISKQHSQPSIIGKKLEFSKNELQKEIMNCFTALVSQSTDTHTSIRSLLGLIVQNAVHTTGFVMEFLFFGVPLLLLRSLSDHTIVYNKSVLIAKYIAFLVETVAANLNDNTNNLLLIRRVVQHIQLILVIDISGASDVDTDTQQLIGIRTKLSKLVKTLLKFGIDRPEIMNVMSSLLVQLYRTKRVISNNRISVEFAKTYNNSIGSSLLAIPTNTATAGADAGDVSYLPECLLDMTCGHSRFPACLVVTDKTSEAAKKLNIPLLKFLLLVISHVTARVTSGATTATTADSNSIDNNDNVASCKLLIQSLLPHYTGTLNVSNRIILRIWHLLSTGKAPVCATIGAINVGCKLTSAIPPDSTTTENLVNFAEVKRKQSDNSKDDFKRRKFDNNSKFSKKFDKKESDSDRKENENDKESNAEAALLVSDCWLFKFIKMSTVQATISDLLDYPRSRTLIPNMIDSESATTKAEYCKEMRALRASIELKWKSDKHRAAVAAAAKAAANKPSKPIIKAAKEDSESEDLSDNDSDKEAEDEDNISVSSTEEEADVEDELVIDDHEIEEVEEVAPSNGCNVRQSAILRILPQFGSTQQQQLQKHQNSLPIKPTADQQRFPTLLELDYASESTHLLINKKHSSSVSASTANQQIGYDVSFILPAVLDTLLHTPYLSVKQLAHKGVLSLVIIALCMHCPVTRAYAVCILEMIHGMLGQQDVHIDVGFTERSEYLILLQFIRNSVSRDTSSEPLKISPSMAMFLAKASIVLLNPAHELFPKMSRYLISKPALDAKDFPMFDALYKVLLERGPNTMQTDESKESSSSSSNLFECLTAMRLIRDGLCSNEDHLNLCRKNCYNRLMLVFPILVANVNNSSNSNDSKLLGNILLDVLDRAMSLPESSKYLLVRCSTFSWLANMSTTTTISSTTTAATAATATSASVYIYGVRLLQLFRKGVNALLLHIVDSGVRRATATDTTAPTQSYKWLLDSWKTCIQSVKQIVNRLVATSFDAETGDIRDLSVASFVWDYLTLLISLLWDVQLLTVYLFACFENAESFSEYINIDFGWNATQLNPLIVLLKRVKASVSTTRDIDKQQLHRQIAAVIALGFLPSSSRLPSNAIGEQPKLLQELCSSSLLEVFVPIAVPSESAQSTYQQQRDVLLTISTKATAETVVEANDEAVSMSSHHDVTEILSSLSNHIVDNELYSKETDSQEITSNAIALAWKAFVSVDFNSKLSTLPSCIDNAELLSLCLLSILESQRSDVLSISSLSATRWLLLVYSNRFQPAHATTTTITASSSIETYRVTTLLQRIQDAALLPIANEDEGSCSNICYNAEASFQLQYRLIVSMLVSFLTSAEINAVPSVELTCLYRALAALLRVSLNEQLFATRIKPAECCQYILNSARAITANAAVRSYHSVFSISLAPFAGHVEMQSIMTTCLNLFDSVVSFVSNLTTEYDRGTASASIAQGSQVSAISSEMCQLSAEFLKFALNATPIATSSASTYAISTDAKVGVRVIKPTAMLLKKTAQPLVVSIQQQGKQSNSAADNVELASTIAKPKSEELDIENFKQANVSSLALLRNAFKFPVANAAKMVVVTEDSTAAVARDQMSKDEITARRKTEEQHSKANSSKRAKIKK